MEIHTAFRLGAKILAADDAKYGTLHKGHGIEQANWDILTQKEYWSPEQARQMRAVMADVIEISLTIAGMPAVPLPGQYAAAVIAEIVSPCNRMLACTKAPDTFDAVDASGLITTHEVKPMTPQQLMGLVLAYSGGYTGEPSVQRLPKDVKQQMSRASKK